MSALWKMNARYAYCGRPVCTAQFLLLFLLFFRSSQYTAQILVGRGRRGRGQASFSEAAGTKAGRQEKRADRANYGELLKDFSSMCT